MNKADSMYDEIAKRLEESARIERIIATSKIGEIESIVKLILAAYKAGGKVILFGNGGNAADAQHLACELVGRVTHNRQALPAIALNTNLPQHLTSSRLCFAGTFYPFRCLGKLPHLAERKYP